MDAALVESPSRHMGGFLQKLIAMVETCSMISKPCFSIGASVIYEWMDIKRQVEYWLTTADSDLKTARILFDAGKKFHY